MRHGSRPAAEVARGLVRVRVQELLAFRDPVSDSLGLGVVGGICRDWILREISSSWLALCPGQDQTSVYIKCFQDTFTKITGAVSS